MNPPLQRILTKEGRILTWIYVAAADRGGRLSPPECSAFLVLVIPSKARDLLLAFAFSSGCGTNSSLATSGGGVLAELVVVAGAG